MVNFQALILENLSLFRNLLFLCCLGYWWILYVWLRPTSQAIRRGALASLVQFWLGLLADILYLKLGIWSYRPMPFTLAGTPFDLHLDWALLWGFGLVWLADRLLGDTPRTRQIFLYIGIWTILTTAFDTVMVESMIFLEKIEPFWWLADLLFLAVIQGITLWFYRSIGTADEPDCGLGAIPPIRPYPRALIYMSFAIPFFFIFVPDQIEAAARMVGFKVNTTPVPLLPQMLTFVAVALGGWATHEFAQRGRGTPVPWDPPRNFVASGPYLFTANPMQQSGLLLTLAVLLARPSWVMVGFFMDVMLMAAVVFALFEPAYLRSHFSVIYASYRAQVKPWHYTFNYQPPKRPIVFYDAGCNLCQVVIQTLMALDYRRMLCFSPLHGQVAREILPQAHLNCLDNSLLFWEPGLTSADPGLISSQARACLRILSYTPLPVSLLAVFEGIPGVTLLGDRLYHFIAARRHKLWLLPGKACRLLKYDERYLP